MKIYLTAIIKSKPEYTTEVLAQLQDMVINSRTESACLQYDLHRDIDDENTFVFYEIWQTAEELAAHNEQPYIKAFGAIVNEKLQEPPTIIKMSLLK